MSDRHYSIVVLPGDGIGREVVAEAERVMDAAASTFGFSVSTESHDWSCEYYTRHGRMMPDEALDTLAPFDAILLGAVGYPGVPDHVSLWGMFIPIRRQFRQYINLRPVKLYEGVTSPLAGRNPGDIDYLIVRENNEGEYSEIGGRLNTGTDEEMCMQASVFTRKGTDRVIDYAFRLAQTRPRKQVT